MATALAPIPTEGYDITLPEPCGKQPVWLDDDHSRKVLRVGRRGQKTRFALICAIAGHGPGWRTGEPLFGGVMSGGDVVWISQDYGQLGTVLWREEIDERFGDLPFVTLNKNDHDVTFEGLGTLFLRSGDRKAIQKVRGIGKRLKGVIVDEAAWLALREALQEVILLALADNDGWLILMSTTNAGWDEGYDDSGQRQIPSYFNVLCEEIRAGKRSEDWIEFVGTAYDNPTLSKTTIDALVAEYTPDSPRLKQEVFAELLRGGIGVALPNLDAAVHLIPRVAPGEFDPTWRHFAALDWGYNHFWSFGHYIADEDGNVCKVETITGRQDQPEQIGQKVVAAGVPLNPKAPLLVFAGHDIFQKKGQAIGYKGPTIAEMLRPFGMRLVKANTNRVQGLDNLRRFTYFERSADGKTITRPPRFYFFDTPGNRACLSQLQGMQVDPDNLEDALKTDADSAGRGGDDMYDETRYGLMSRWRSTRAVDPAVVKQDHVRQIDYRKGE